MATRKTARVETPTPTEIRTYGCPVAGKDQFFYDRWAFAYRVPIDKGAPMRKNLFRSVVDRLNPKYFEWHGWTNAVVEAMCQETWIAFAGCSNSAKTHNIAGFACAWWLAAPDISSVIFCSTTAKSLRRRGWANVQMFHTMIPGPRIGNFVDSRMLWQAKKGDDKHAVMGIAVEEGETVKVADNIKGVHTVRQMVIIDEATAVPPAIFDAATNLYSYPREFILVMIGNPRSRLDQFGKFMEPYQGWNSVSVNTEFWETKEQIDGKRGVCVRFDAEKSPNITEGKVVSRHLPLKEKVEALRGAPGAENDPTYWSNQRGFPPPEGLNKCVFSESMFITHDAYGTLEFTGKDLIVVGVLDPARAGGDRPAIRFAKIGEIRGGKWGIQIGKPKTIRFNSASNNPIDYQLTEQCERECAKIDTLGPSTSEVGWWCPPEHFGVDATGGGADLCDIMQRTWSPKIIRIGFGESPSAEQCSFEDVRPADTVYKNRRAEMYFRTANAVKSGQLKGMDRETAKELVGVEFDDSGSLIKLMSKEDYKDKFGISPDYGDTAIMIVEVARRLGFRLAPIGKTVERVEQNGEMFQKAQAVYEDVSYEEEELSFEIVYQD